MKRRNIQGKKARGFLPSLSTVLVFLPMLLGADSPGSPQIMHQTLHKQFTISLKSNPSTGYKWQAGFNKNVIELVKETYEKPSAKLLGASGQQVFVFRPVKTGETKIEMIYKRRWEKSFAQRQVYHIKISP